MNLGGVDSDEVGPPGQSSCAIRFGKRYIKTRVFIGYQLWGQIMYLGINQHGESSVGEYLGELYIVV